MSNSHDALCALRRLLALIITSFFVGGPGLAQPVLESQPPVQRLLPPSESAAAPSTAAGAPAALLAGSVEDEYLLQPGDEISVMDPSMATDAGPFTTVVPILPDGTASIYPVGVVTAKGKTIKQLNDEVRQKASDLILNPGIVISLSRMRPIEVYVLGNVVSPGLYTVEADRGARERQTAMSQTNLPTIPLPGRYTGGPLTSLGAGASPVRAFPQGSLTVLTALQMAGGVRENADIRNIIVRRPGMVDKSVDLWSMVAEGDSTQDFVLRAGDVIMVRKGGAAFDAELLGAAANRKRAVRIFGAVKSPGIYELTPRDDLISIISRAGGFTETAVKSHVTLSRQDRTGKVETFKLAIKRSVRDGKSTGRLPVMPGDVVVVRDSIVLKAAPRVATVAGAFLSAFFILYFSRIIVDQSQPTTATTTTGTTGNTTSTTNTTTPTASAATSTTQ
ncbi:MAG: SLBB domain-containing protein [Candidatus Obscuribacterales bacterium]|nr:SLBB domain-containing protein [Candidatus Obscuribacterales bacterium]